MAAVLSEVPKRLPSKEVGNSPLLDRFSARRSKELVVAFAGPIGCGIASVINITEECLRAVGYSEVVRIKLSDFLEEATKTGRIADATNDPTRSQKFNRYRRLQETGMELRKQTLNQAILAEYAIKTIRFDREKRTPTPVDANYVGPVVPLQVAYLIDQVKRPEEVVLLRALYRNLFHLVGVTKTYDERLQLLEDDGVKAGEAALLVEIDRNENSDAGQKLDKTLHLADYFVRNEAGRAADKNKRANIDRFIRLVHGDKISTPTNIEQGMYAAFAAGLRSGCLSRQVGAAIATPLGQIIATGCNDVPMAGGGLYSEGEGVVDQRCLHRPEMHCFNDFHKRQLQQKIGEELDAVLAKQLGEEAGISLTPLRREVLLESIYKKTRLKDLIEYSRSVHAEMDAIVSMARSGGRGIQDAILFTTTFPCHSCARHIVAAGIAKVYYIEPYEKSMARDLHADAISFELSVDTGPKVQFIHFEGISPRRFSQFFQADGRKDGNGRLMPMVITPAEKILPEYLDNYQVFEEKAVEHFMADLEKVPPNN